MVPSLAVRFALSVPLVLAGGAALVPSSGALRWARRVTQVAAGLVLVTFACAASLGAPVAFVRLDAPACVMLVLVASLGVVVTSFSQTYLVGEPGLRRYARALLVTLSAVMALLMLQNLALMATAWVVTSLSLHQLLTFYPDRRPALVAAHQKFVLSRLADVCLVFALGLIGLQAGSLDLEVVTRALSASAALNPRWEAAAVLVAIAVVLKSAQLPFHGWLTQVMEAPTPVSALLHAGVVNLGGFFLIRLSPLLERVPAAMTVLCLFGLSTALLGGLVMMTRVSIKLSLAWSTCAQLGFMLVQCSLGAWDLALLHLVAHSLYKAHAFLTSGSTVSAWRVRSLVPAQRPALSRPLLGIAALGLLAVVLLVKGVGVMVPLSLSLSLSVPDALTDLRRLARVAGLGALAFVWHVLSGSLVARGAAPEPWMVAVATAGLLVLAVVQAVLRARPAGAFSRALQPRLFAGFSLDAWFRKLAFRWWPPTLPREVRLAPVGREVAAR